MDIIKDIGTCTCCNNYCEYIYGKENFNNIEKTLDNYNNYKDIYVYKCPKCGFVSTDITGKEGVLASSLISTKQYNDYLNNSYLNGFDEESLDEQHSKAVPAYLYEAYSLICLEMKDYEKYIRVMNKCIELKEMTIRKYRFSQAECAEEDENDEEYEAIISLIKKSIQKNSMELNNNFSNLKIGNFFTIVIFAENLIRLNQLDKAKKIIDSLRNDINVNKDLVDYLDQKVNYEDIL